MKSVILAIGKNQSMLKQKTNRGDGCLVLNDEKSKQLLSFDDITNMHSNVTSSLAVHVGRVVISNLVHL